MRGVLRHPLAVVAGALLLTGWTLSYTREHLRVDTDREGMISEELPFRQRDLELRRQFPQLENPIVWVVDAPLPEQARDLARRLADRLRAEPDRFRNVYLPRADRFLETHGLYFLSKEELRELGDELVRIQPFLGRLTRQGGLAGLADMLRAALEERAKGKDLEVAPLLRELAAAVRARAHGESHPVSWERLMRAEPDGTSSTVFARELVIARAVMDYGKLFPAGSPIAEARRLAREFSDPEHGVRIRLTGSVPLAQEEFEAVMRGWQWIALFVFLGVTAVLFWGLRDARLVAVSLGTLGIGLAWTTAFALATVGHFNLISVAFAALYLGLGVDYAIHFLFRFDEHHRTPGTLVDALVRAASDVGPALGLCTLTTAIGFYAFLPTAYAGVSELGLIAGTGMFVSLFATLTVLPASVALVRPRPTPQGAPRLTLRVARGLARPRHRTRIRIAAAISTLAGMAGLGAVRFDPNPLNLRDPRSESVETFRDLLATAETPPWSLHLLARNASELREERRRLRDLPQVGRVVSIDDLVPDDQPEKEGELEELSWTLGGGLAGASGEPEAPEARRAALEELRRALEAYLATPQGRADAAARDAREALAELESSLAKKPPETFATTLEGLEKDLLGTLPENVSRLERSLGARPFTAQDLSPSFRERWINENGVRRVEVFPAEDLDDIRSMRSFVDAVLAEAPSATGTPLSILASSDAVVRAFRRAVAFALLAITGLLFVLLRRSLAVLQVLGPLLFAALMTCATLPLLGLSFNFANVIGIPLLLGIGVDSNIHVVHRARLGTLPPGGLLATGAARAILCSSLTTLCSFLALSLSAHPGTASMGVLLTVGILWSLVASLVVLPAFLPASAAPRAPEGSRTAPPSPRAAARE